MGADLFIFRQQKKFYDLGWKYRPCSEDIKYYQWIAKLMKKFVKTGKLLDIACGEGILLKEVESDFESYGIDISDSAISRAKKICKKTNFKVCPAEKIDYPNNCFDVVTCLGSLEHFIKPETVLKKIAKILKKDGVSIIVLPNSWYMVDFLYRGLIRGEDQTSGQQLERFYSKLGGKKFLEKNGLKVIEIKKYNTYNAPIPKKVKFLPLRVLLQVLWKIFIRPFIFMNVSYQFCYICKK